MSESIFNPLVRKLERSFPLTAEELSALEGACSSIITAEADRDLVREGDEPEECHLLLEGVACRYKLTVEGKRQIMSFQFPGDIYDAQSFILEVMDHSIAAITPCKIAVIPHATMLEITEDFPRIARAIWKDTLIDAAVFREWLLSVGRRSSYARIAHLMCEVFIRLEIVGLADNNTISWPITQEEVGDALGLSFVHVNRTLKQLREAGLIRLSGKKLVILDWEGLKLAGEFEPGYLHLRPTANGAPPPR